MHVQALKQLGSVQYIDANWSSMVKETMMLISSMDPKWTDLRSLNAINANIFPVKIGQGPTRPTNSKVEFAIRDLPKFEGLFPDIAVLDFTLQEIHTLKRFLLAMGFANRYMSASVTEETTKSGGTLNSSLTEFLKSRAYALFR